MGESLSWNAHVKHVLSKAGKRVVMLGTIKKDVTINTASIIYKSFILPIFDYCDTTWNCCGKVNAVLVETLQRCAARIIMKKARSDGALNSLR